MKKVALIITRMIPGGASKVVLQIIDAASGKYDITLVCGKEDLDPKIIELLSGRCKVVVIPSLIRNISPLKDYKAYKEILFVLHENEYDVVHTHTSKAGFIGRKAAAKAEVPVIIHSPHGSIYTEGNNIEGVPSLSLGKKILQLAEKSAGKKTTWLTTLSEHEKNICLNLSLSKEENTVVIHNGIEVEDFSVTPEERKSERESFEISESDIVLLSVGRLSSEKGHSVLIDSFFNAAELISEKKNLKLMIVGEGPERESLEKQASSIPSGSIAGTGKKNQVSNILFVGHSDEVKKYFAMSDIFILPSLYEGFGIVVLEAMAAGLPVIASNVGGIPEIISNGTQGILVEPSNPVGLSEAIKSLADDNEKNKRLGNAGKERVKEFTVKKMQEAYLKLYE